jgi:hypothetical protein
VQGGPGVVDLLRDGPVDLVEVWEIRIVGVVGGVDPEVQSSRCLLCRLAVGRSGMLGWNHFGAEAASTAVLQRVSGHLDRMGHSSTDVVGSGSFVVEGHTDHVEVALQVVQNLVVGWG